MDYYQIWCNLIDSTKDVEFARDVRAYMDFLKGKGLIAGYTLTRRKFGFGPAELGEFNITIATENLAQLERAFQEVATRSGDVEKRHHPVYSAVKDFRSGLYRDFPDPVRVEK